MGEIMDRRRFIQGMAAATAAIKGLPAAANETMSASPSAQARKYTPGSLSTENIDVTGYTFLCNVQKEGKTWKVYEDLRVRDGAIVFLSGKSTGLVLSKSAEAAFADSNPPYLGLNIRDIGLSGPDLLADRLLKNGDPDPEEVRSAAPPLGSAPLREP